MTTAPRPRNFSFSGFIRLIRVQNLLIIVLSQYLVALYLLEGVELMSFKLFLLSLSTIIIAASGYIINDYYDVKIDYVNKPERVVVGKVLKRRVVLFWHSLLNIIAIAIGYFLDWKLALVYFASAFLLWVYSNQLKRWPFIGNLTVALLTGLSLTVVSLYYGQKVVLANIYAVFAFSISLIREIIKDMEDWKGDAVFGCRTLPILYGIRKTKLIIYTFIGLFGFLIFYLTQYLHNNTLYYYFSGLALFIIYFIYKLHQADKIRDYHFLSSFCKLIMLSGILSITLF